MAVVWKFKETSTATLFFKEVDREYLTCSLKNEIFVRLPNNKDDIEDFVWCRTLDYKYAQKQKERYILPPAMYM